MMNQFQMVSQEVIAKANRPNNSGYLSLEHEECNVFPILEQQYFRIEDDKTILELQKLYEQSMPRQIDYTADASSQFTQKMSSLISTLDSKRPTQMIAGKLQIGNVYYSLQDTKFDQELAYQAMINRFSSEAVTQGIRKLSIQQHKPLPSIKFKKRADNLLTKMNKLDIQQY